MKKWLSLFLSFVLLLGISSAYADAQSDFFAFVDEVWKQAPQGFFKYPGKLFHSPILQNTNSADAILADETKRCLETANRFSEVAMLKRYSPAASQYFGELTVEADFTKPSYIGRDGEILSCYIQGVDSGYFMIYDLVSQLMYLDFVPLDEAEQVESILFERCADGYFINDPAILEDRVNYSLESYAQLVEQILAS